MSALGHVTSAKGERIEKLKVKVQQLVSRVSILSVAADAGTAAEAGERSNCISVVYLSV